MLVSALLLVMTQPSNSKPPLGDQIAEAIRQVLKPGGVTVGSGVAFWQLMVEDSVSKAVVAFLIGAGTSYGARMLKPLHEKSLQTAEQVGETFSGAFEEISQRAIAAASGFEKRYLLCQASDCESVRERLEDTPDGSSSLACRVVTCKRFNSL